MTNTAQTALDQIHIASHTLGFFFREYDRLRANLVEQVMLGNTAKMHVLQTQIRVTIDRINTEKDNLKRLQRLATHKK